MANERERELVTFTLVTFTLPTSPVEKVVGRVRRGRPLLSRPRGAVDSGLAAVLAAVESVAVFVRVCVVGFGWMVVRFVRVIRLPACARVSRVSRVLHLLKS